MFSEIVGNKQAQEVLRRMLAQERVPGAMIFAGPEGVGKKLYALELARVLNCDARHGDEACGECPACKRIWRLSLSTADDQEAAKQIIWSGHRDVGLIRPAARFIVVDQVRELERETNFRPHEGARRVFIIDDADRLNESASNALLKTLEEAPPTTLLILITARPSGLLATIRSRCQIVRFAPLPAAEVEEFLVSRYKRSGAEASLAARLARGSIGRALELNIDAYREQRESMLGVIEALIAGGGGDRERLLRAAEELTDAKRKDEYEPRLDALQTLLRDVWLLTLRTPGAELINEDARERLARFSAGVESRRAARWISQIEELRQQLGVNINRRVATDALFLSMAAA